MKRWISMLLAVVLALGMSPLSVQAQQNTSTAELTNNDISIEGTNGFGSLLSQDLQQYQQSTSAESEYDPAASVTDVQIEGSAATVTYSAPGEAILLSPCTARTECRC